MKASTSVIVAALTLASAGSERALGQDRFPESVTSPGPTTRPAPSKSVGVTPAPGPSRGASSRFAAAAVMETEDFGVKAIEELRGPPHHAPTPTQIPGGAVISTEALHALTETKDARFIIFDVLGGVRGLPGAQNAQPAGGEGSFTDAVQRNFGQYLQRETQGKKDLPLIFYCQNVQCWRSYNAARRAITLGFTRVHWYRGGIDAWTQAGLPTAARQP